MLTFAGCLARRLLLDGGVFTPNVNVVKCVVVFFRRAPITEKSPMMLPFASRATPTSKERLLERRRHDPFPSRLRLRLGSNLPLPLNVYSLYVRQNIHHRRHLRHGKASIGHKLSRAHLWFVPKDINRRPKRPLDEPHGRLNADEIVSAIGYSFQRVFRSLAQRVTKRRDEYPGRSRLDCGVDSTRPSSWFNRGKGKPRAFERALELFARAVDVTDG